MFRTAIIRSAAAATRITARPVLRAPVFRVAARQATVPRVTVVKAVRMYSAASGLEEGEVTGRIIAVLQGFDKVSDVSKITPTAHFANDLGLDSLDTVEVVMAIEEEFSIEIPDKEADAIHSVDQAVKYIMSQPDAN